MYETGVIKFKNYEKQISITFKIYADTECFLKRINIDKSKYKQLYQKHIPNSIGAKLICIDKLLFYKVKIVSIILLNGFLHNKKELIK